MKALVLSDGKGTLADSLYNRKHSTSHTLEDRRSKMRILITGGSGLFGAKLAEIAKKKDAEVFSGYNQDRVTHGTPIQFDVSKKDQVENAFKKVNPEAVVHAASLTDVDKCETNKELAWKINVEGTRNIAEACQKVNAKLVVISTDYVFDGEKGLYNEEDKPNPVNYYGLTKLEGERQVINYCENYAILRTSVLYGWHPWKQNFATWIINKLKQRQEITVVEDHYNTPTLAGNLAEMAVEVAEKDLRGVYHASGNERISRYEFAKQIAETFNLNSSLIKPVKMSQLTAWTARRPKDSSLDTGKIEKQLKTKPLNITEGLNKMKEEMKI